MQTGLPSSLRSWGVFIAIPAIGIALLAWVLVGGRGTGTSGPGRTEPQVLLVHSRLADVPRIVEAQGHVVPINEVEIHPQITGVVASIELEEGRDVVAGQLLFTLDAGDAPALVRQARAKHAQASAELEDARRNQRRAQELTALKYLSPSDLEATASRVKVLQAQQQAGLAEIESAEVKLAYTRIVAPVSGRTGAVSVRRGALVRSSDPVGMVRIVQMDPIAVEFSVPERELAASAQVLQDGTAWVTAETVDGPIRGRIVFTDNAIDTTTGTIRLKARFANPDRRLWPGAFVHLRVEAGMQRDVVVLPPQALLEGPDGHFVYRLGADDKVQAHPVDLVGVQDGVAIVTGLEAGDAIVAEGNQTLQDGMTVRVQPQAQVAATP